jgi:hypothetical protein
MVLVLAELNYDRSIRISRKEPTGGGAKRRQVDKTTDTEK